MEIVRQEQKILVHVVMPDSAGCERRAPNDSFALEFLAGPAHVVRAAQHKHVFRELLQPLAEIRCVGQHVVAVGPYKPIAGALREGLVASPRKRIDVPPRLRSDPVAVLREHDRDCVSLAPVARNLLRVVWLLRADRAHQ